MKTISIDERRFSFIHQKKWKNLTDDERRTLGSYKSYYGKYKSTDDEIIKLENSIKKLREKRNDYLIKLKTINYKIDYLRSDYNYSWSVSKLKNKNHYNFTISRRGHNTKTGSLGSPKLIEKHLQDFYKRKKKRLEELNKIGWKMFVRKRVMDSDGRIRNMLIDMVSEDVTMKKSFINRNTLFPLVEENSKPKSKGVSIPIMITNQMRIKLSTLGYSKEEMKHLTPIESHKIINKGVPKKPSIDRSRNQ